MVFFGLLVSLLIFCSKHDGSAVLFFGLYQVQFLILYFFGAAKSSSWDFSGVAATEKNKHQNEELQPMNAEEWILRNVLFITQNEKRRLNVRKIPQIFNKPFQNYGKMIPIW